MTYQIIITAVYAIVLGYTIFRILLDTHSTSKTLAYLLLVFIFPIIGSIFYFALGVNYRHKRYNKRAVEIHKKLDKSYKTEIHDPTDSLLNAHESELGNYYHLVQFQHEIMGEFLSENSFKLLTNGEQKFPEVLKTLETAKHFIHMEYYEWANDTRGNQIKEVLIRKVKQGIKIRVLYDDYASKGIKNNIVKELKTNGVDIYPKIKVKIRRFAHRLNHRDHRKLIIIDGHIGFVGGINISDNYDNSIDTGLYWRDTHVKCTGPVVRNLQRHFLVSWNSAQKDQLEFHKELFPDTKLPDNEGTRALAQTMAGGPIYPMSTVMLTYLKVFSIATQKLYVTNPYFIPNESILDTLKQSALSGTDVRLLFPYKPDSKIVGTASRFFFDELLKAGVRIYLYKKGFVHAKTVVADGFVSVIGTANMDIRSFDLNFEIMSLIYGKDFASQLEKTFIDDLNDCHEVTLEEWNQKGTFHRLLYAIARLISSFL